MFQLLREFSMQSFKQWQNVHLPPLALCHCGTLKDDRVTTCGQHCGLTPSVTVASLCMATVPNSEAEILNVLKVPQNTQGTDVSPLCHKVAYEPQMVAEGRGGTSTNNSGRLLADQKSARHRALAKFSIHHYRNQHPIWRLP